MDIIQVRKPSGKPASRHNHSIGCVFYEKAIDASLLPDKVNYAGISIVHFEKSTFTPRSVEAQDKLGRLAGHFGFLTDRADYIRANERRALVQDFFHLACAHLLNAAVISGDKTKEEETRGYMIELEEKLDLPPFNPERSVEFLPAIRQLLLSPA